MGQRKWCLISKLYFPEAAISPVLSAAAQILHQCHLKSILYDGIYGFDMVLIYDSGYVVADRFGRQSALLENTGLYVYTLGSLEGTLKLDPSRLPKV